MKMTSSALALCIMVYMPLNSSGWWKGPLFNPAKHLTQVAVALSTDNFYAVDEGKLYRSAQLSPKRLTQRIKKYGIKTIVNLRDEALTSKVIAQEKVVCNNNNVVFVNIPMVNTFMSKSAITSKAHIRQLLAVYDDEKKYPRPLLIHCKAGADRTGEAAAMWVLEKQRHASRQEAIDKALAQLRPKYAHIEVQFPAKRAFIQSWPGRQWLDA